MNNAQASYRVIVDAKKINALLNELNFSDKDTQKAIKAALRKSAGMIRKEAQRNLSAIGNLKHLKKEINIAVYRNAAGARIDLLDRRKKNSRAYMLKFFELGTDSRATKKGYNRGNINATYFFRNAVNSKKSEAESSLQKNIIDSIRKIQNKNK